MLAKDATLTAISFIGVIVMFMVSYYLCGAVTAAFRRRPSVL